ncbi:MAG: ankyrin repeat domain-containing protein [Sulfuritalea sp.]|nr:ankyrin repeat domain-containing protein [Sulfuritalea sp.]
MPDRRRRLIATLFATMLVAAVLPSSAWAGAYEDILAAAHRNDTETVADFIRRGMDVNTSDRSGTSLLMIAAGNGNEQLLETLLRNRANILKKNKYGDSAITLAALKGHLPVLRRLIEQGGAERINDPGWGALHYASFGGHADTVRFLISMKASLNAMAPNGQTALILATRNGHLEVVRLLVDAGADVNLADSGGNSALKTAQKSNHSEIADFLKKSGAVD